MSKINIIMINLTNLTLQTGKYQSNHNKLVPGDSHVLAMVEPEIVTPSRFS